MRQAVILAGGRGTRLSTLWSDRPKALVPVAGRPFLEWQLRWLARGGIARVHIAAGYKADQLAAWLQEKKTENISISVEPVPLGTGGGLKFAEPWIQSDPFLVLNGDSLLPNLVFQTLEKTYADFSKVWKKSRPRVPRFGKNGKKVSKVWKNPGIDFPTGVPPGLIAITRIEEAGRYGTVEFEGSGRITAFREKARHRSGWVNGGVYLLPRNLLSLLAPEQNMSLETDIFPELALHGLLAAHPAPPPLLDMGTPEGLSALESYLTARKPSW